MNEQTTTILIDTALASGSASALDPEERQLQELVLALCDDAPTPDAGFELRMNARVAAGFPRKGAGRRVPVFLTKRPQLAALGAAAALLIALVVALSVTNRPQDSASSSTPSVGGGVSASDNQSQAPVETAAAPARQKAASPSGGATESLIAPPPPSSGGFVGGRNRKVEQSAALVLAAPKDELSDVGDRVIAVTDRYRGFVLHASVTSTAGEEGSTGSFDLRVPVRNLRATLRDLSALADVRSRTENADDVTASFSSARTRLQELKAERRGLLRRLETAASDQAAAAIRARIRNVNAEIDAQNRVLAEMRRRTNYASVSVMLQEDNDGSGGGGIGDGARDLRDSLVDSANIALRALGVALPIGLVLALLWAGGGWFTRRRREAVLD